MISRLWTSLILSLACASTIAWLVALMHEKGVRPVRDIVSLFKKQPRSGRVVLVTFFTALWIFASNKSGGGGGDGGGGDGGTNNIQMVIGPDSGLQPLDSLGAVTNDQLQGFQGGVQPPQGGLVGDPAPAKDEWSDFTPITSMNTTRTLDGDDFRRGFVLTRVGTDEAFTFAAPAGANVCADWRAFGAASDWIYFAFADWAFQLGTNEVDRLRVHSDGWVEMLGGRLSPAAETAHEYMRPPVFYPFKATIGIVPEANWHMMGNGEQGTGNGGESQFWHYVTPSNTLQLTWQNVLLGRLTNTPVSVQMEVWPSGRFSYRYDLSRLGAEEVTNILVGASLGSLAWTTNALPTNITSITFYPLSPEDAANEDRDGDGLSLLDELFVFGTDPGFRDTDFDGASDGDEVTTGTNPLARDSDGDGLVDGSDPDPAVETSLADLDGDGIPDAYEDYWFGGTNAFNTATNRDDTGFTLDTKMLGGINPTNLVAAANVVSTNGLVSWKLFDAFAVDWPANATSLVWERTFAVNRSSAWQQFFVSAAPTNAAAWSLHGAVLEWETDTGTSGSAAASPFGDSFRIPLAAEDFPSSITLRLLATGGTTVHSPTPIHLVAYSPEFRVEGGNEITGDSGAKFYVFTEGSDSQISLVIDHSLRPCNASPVTDECDMDELENMSTAGGDFSFDGNSSGGTITANRPGIYTLPDFTLNVALQAQQLRAPRRGGGGGGRKIVVLDPSVGWNCNGHGCGYDGLGYDWHGDYYYEEDYYPLDTRCLRKKWYRDWGGGWYHDNCDFWVSSGLGDDCGFVTTSSDGNRGAVYVDGVAVWSGSAEHTYDDTGCVEYGEDGCSGCDEDCANGNCDSLEGPSLGSLKFRIPLGAPVKGQVAGFVWFSTECPTNIGKSSFQLLGHPDANITESTEAGIRRIACHDSRGRDLRIEDMANGARVTIYDTAAQTLEHTWEIVNVNGSASCVRLRKISRLNNVMSDETYTYADGDWTQFDNIAGVGTQLTTYNDFADYGDGVKSETRTTTDANGNVLSSVTTEQSRIGECENAVIRETYRYESTGRGGKWSQADYWNDPAHSGRHGQPRLVWGNARAWTYTDFDELGHETLRIEQRGDADVPSDFPYVVSNELCNASVLADAFVTVRDFEPLSGDSGHQDDAARPRIETRYVVTNGVATLVGRTWTRYTRLNRDGYAAIKAETWRAGAQGAAIGDAGNSYSYKITYADTGDGTPLLMRNAVAESLDENGVLTVNAYSLSGNVLSCETRRYGPSYLSQSSQMSQFPTYETMETDATYGTLLRKTTRLSSSGTVIADEQSIYDSQNRLRSTTYLDGTSLTNAYSCCRLLWKRDREGRKILRSAQTGTDHLYNAMEDVWLREVGNREQGTGNGATNGFRVTQHFYDALGRETNTVVYVGTTPGEATVASASDGKAYMTVTTSYPCGGGDYVVSTDERGKVTIRRIDILGNCIESGEAVFTNGVEVVKTKNRSYFGGGSSMRREWGVDGWTEEHRFTDYAADGKRIEYVVTESFDCGVVTNSVSTYDLLGRIVSKTVPGANGSAIVTVNTYDGASSRILSSTYTAGDIVRTTTYLYNDFGEQVGTVLDGVTNRTDVTYAEISNEWWRVETSSVIGPHTNSLTIAKTQLTGLSDALRRHEVTMVGCADPIAPQTVTETTASYDPTTGIETETMTSSMAPSVTRRRMYGLLLAAETDGETTASSYDALWRVAATFRTIGEGEPLPLQSFGHSPIGDLIAKHTYTNSGEVVSETYAYDMLGNRIAITDALGNTIYRTYDPFSNVIAEWGATYPVRYTYDSQNRRTALSTTRDGETWDTTTWAYDAATGNCLSKTYADGSTVAYTYTPDNLPLRTIYASGRWMENAYDARRQVVAVEYSEGETFSLAYDAFSNEIAASNGVAFATFDRDANGNCTNDTVAVGEEIKTTRRIFDAFNRLTGIDGTTYDYNADGLIASISNAIAVVDYYYTPDRLDAGYSLTLSNGMVFTRSILRDGYRRPLVTGISSIVNGVGVGSLAYTYDPLNRPTSRNNDMFGYNERSEVTAANVSGVPAAYGYDEIGNSTNWTANCLNQYTDFTHDADGNMTQCGNWTYIYDAANRLKTVSSNGVLLVTNFYDAKSRRVKKVTSEATTTFFYDGWNLIEERIAYTNGTSSTIRYFWGKDLSGTLQGAGGVGGLLYQAIDNAIYIPCYDNNGNITRYYDSSGNLVAQCSYDAFGNIISQSGPLADVFRFQFSTKYFDLETRLYYYSYRYYMPVVMRWINRDPIDENGGANLYCFVKNASPSSFDALGLEKMSLSYDFATDTSWFERVVNWSTRSGLSVEAAQNDIVTRVKPYGKTGRGKCKCIEHIILAGHGYDGAITLGDGDRNTLTGAYMRMAKSGSSGRYIPTEILSLISTIKSRACEHMTIEFASCLSGRGALGQDLKGELQSFFGEGVTVILYDREVKLYFNSVH